VPSCSDETKNKNHLCALWWCVGVQFDQNQLAVKLGDIQLMEAGQPLGFDAKTASKYLKDTCAKHGTVNIYVSVGKGPGTGEWCAGWGHPATIVMWWRMARKVVHGCLQGWCASMACPLWQTCGAVLDTLCVMNSR